MNVAKRKANWLPLPKTVKSLNPVSNVMDYKIKFPIGEVVRFLPNLGVGKIKIKENEFVPFAMSEINRDLNLGSVSIGVGSRVGFDVSITPNGRRVTRLKVL